MTQQNLRDSAPRTELNAGLKPGFNSLQPKRTLRLDSQESGLVSWMTMRTRPDGETTLQAQTGPKL
jgi:hypothetical protein